MIFYYVYILKCSDNSYYTGITNDLCRRIEEHNNGVNPTCYTHNRRPVHLAFSSEFIDVNLAILFEKQIKGWSRKKKEAIINGDWNLLPELSKNKMKK
ncbi:GIY-YIG nuclease family protein [Kaistella flava (ex Peng et al. 2021)]|uniref:GIY-YIG nuclease family protein n=1 Tax=Kaistella flava (ex Peng et al. 2021) TaxID=2038776 RepID=A0A7M2Y6V0_9FLAO|nr:GIY-YIG nuclease family protein [Kaistella flava (ex Peng et al. 2021)]QOW09152.1 GIY-YIG nuclease family protein [Kaistella flava (ex Peng et al. 2021)]